MPVPEISKIHQQQSTSYDVPLRRFYIRFGYEDEDSVQIRLEDNGDVYLCDDRETRPFGQDKTLSATVPFEMLAEEWPRFVTFVRAKAAELKGKSDEREKSRTDP